MAVRMRVIPLFVLLASVFSFSSCGLVDFEFGDDERYTHIFFDPDSITVMVGDSIEMVPMVSAITTLPGAVYWESTADSVAKVEKNIFYALSEGEARITATSLYDKITADCGVYVIPKWQVNVNDYSTCTVVYANPVIGGRKFKADSLIVGVFCGAECRGIAELKEAYGTDYLQIRIYNDIDIDGSDEPETAVFRVYDRRKYRWTYCEETVILDGETHGTLSDLTELHPM